MEDLQEELNIIKLRSEAMFYKYRVSEILDRMRDEINVDHPYYEEYSHAQEELLHAWAHLAELEAKIDMTPESNNEV